MSLLTNRQKTFVRDAWFEITNNGKFSLGRYNAALEEAYAEYIGKGSALALASGTKSIEAALRIPFKSFRSIYIPELTVPMVRWAAEWAAPNSEVVKIGTDTRTNLMDVDSFEPLKDDAVVVVWTAGVATKKEIDRIAQWRAAGVYVVEDCSHAHFLSFEGKRLGSFGNAAAWSLYPTKAMHGGGEGGLLVADTDLTEFRVWRNGGKEDNGANVLRGKNTGRADVCRMGEVGCATALSFLLDLDSVLSERNNLANIYDSYGLTCMQRDVGVGVNGYKYSVKLGDTTATELESVMAAAGVRFTNRTHGVQDVGLPMHKSTAVAMENHVSLPLMRVTEDEAHKIGAWMRKTLPEIVYWGTS